MPRRPDLLLIPPLPQEAHSETSNPGHKGLSRPRPLRHQEITFEKEETDERMGINALVLFFSFAFTVGCLAALTSF